MLSCSTYLVLLVTLSETDSFKFEWQSTIVSQRLLHVNFKG